VYAVKEITMTRTTQRLLLTMLVAQLPATQLFAQAPANDSIENPVVIAAVPYQDAVDTRQGSTAEDDPYCAGRGATVWYAFTSPQSVRLEANTLASNYDTTLSVYTGTPGTLTQVSCNDDSNDSLQSRVRFNAQAGVTYFMMVGSYGDTPGGDLTFTVTEAPALPPLLTIDLTIDARGRVDASTGLITVTGTVRCSRPSDVVIEGEVDQKRGGVLIGAGLWTYVFCTGDTAWSATTTAAVRRQRGRSVVTFTAGPSPTRAVAYAYDQENEVWVNSEDGRTVQATGRAH
jgi:hypothetical protein